MKNNQTTTEEKIEEIYIHNVIDVRVSSGAIYKVRMIDEIMQLIAKEKKALLEACREIVYSCIYDKEWVELGHPENFEAGKLNETLLEEKLQNLAHSQANSAEERSEDREGKDK